MRTGILSDENVIKDCAEYQSLPLNTQIRARSRPKHIKALTDSVQKIQRQQQGLSSINETGLALNQYRRTNQQNLVNMPLPTPINIYLGLTSLQIQTMKIFENLTQDQQLTVAKALQIDTTNAESQQFTTEDAAKTMNDYFKAIANINISPDKMRKMGQLAQLALAQQTPQTPPSMPPLTPSLTKKKKKKGKTPATFQESLNKMGYEIIGSSPNQAASSSSSQQAGRGRRRRLGGGEGGGGFARDHGATLAVANTPQQQAAQEKYSDPNPNPDTGKRH